MERKAAHAIWKTFFGISRGWSNTTPRAQNRLIIARARAAVHFLRPKVWRREKLRPLRFRVRRTGNGRARPHRDTTIVHRLRPRRR